MHIGQNPMEERMFQRFWFPHYRIYTASFIHSCAVCELKFPSKKKPARPPSAIIYEEAPLDRVQADLIKINENLKDESGKQYVYIFTCVDHHSKRAWAKCLKNKNSKSVSKIIEKLFDKIFSDRGIYPKLFHTDNGGEFRNDLMKKICKEKNIRQIHGAPYHSQSQGLVERFNRSVQDQLLIFKNNKLSSAYAKYQNEIGHGQKQDDTWDLKSALRLMIKEYNSRMHSTTKCTPNEAFY